MGVLFLTFLGQFQAKQATVIPLGQKQTVIVVMQSSDASVSESPAPEASEPPAEARPIVTHNAAPIPTSASSLSTPTSFSSVPTSSRPTSTSSVSSITDTASSISAPSSTSSSLASSSSSSVAPTATQNIDEFPAFDHTSFPVGKVPNWGAMRTPQEWNRRYSEMTDADFVRIPRYDMSVLAIPMKSLTNPVTDENIPTITAKLFYSTRYLGRYDLDAAEGSGQHAGVDLKLARGTPIGAIAGGRVVSVTTTQMLGLHVVIEHRLKNGTAYFSVYGHFDSSPVKVGQDVRPGQTIGYVGMTGNTSAPHLHLQIDRGEPGEQHVPFAEGGNPSAAMMNPITFIGSYRNGE